MDHGSERSDRRGFGETFPRAPPGLSRSDWGLNSLRINLFRFLLVRNDEVQDDADN